MPVIFPDPAAHGEPTETTVYVWEHLGQTGDYILCSNVRHRDLQNASWRLRGKLEDVLEMNGLPRATINHNTRGGSLFFVHRNQQGHYVI
jgi:hypothetical protein